MLPIGSIFFPLRVARMRIEGIQLRIRQYTNLLKSPIFDTVNVKFFTIVVLTV